MKVKIRGLVFAGFAAAVFAQSAMAVDTDDKTVTSKTYVDSKIEASDGTATTIGPSSPENKAPSSKNVYLALQEIETQQGNFQRKLTADEKGPHIGIIVDRGTNGEHDYQSEWQEIGGSTYVSVGSNTGGTAISVGLNDGKIANTAAVIAGSNGQGPATGDEDDLTTARAVYDFVTNPNTGFQRKITSQEATSLAGFNNNTDAGEGVMIGHRGDGANDDSEWYVFGAKANGVDQSNSANNHLSYLYVAEDASESRKKFLISIKDGALAESGNAIITGGTASGAEAYLTRDKLTTAKAVYEYAAQKDWGTANAGKHLVVGSDGLVALSTNTNPDIPEPTDTRCTQAGGTHVCALVAYYDATLGGVKYEWTVMAPTE